MHKPRTLLAGIANPHVPGYLRGANASSALIELLAVSDYDRQRLDLARSLLPNRPRTRFFADYVTMLDAFPEAEAVIIGSDNLHHFSMFTEAIRRNLHVYMMKVISMDETECQQMLKLAQNYDRQIAVELELHFSPQFRYARDLIASGRLGRIESVYLTNVSQSPCHYFPNWGDPLLSYGKVVPLRAGSRTCRGGAITDHPHPYDLIRWLFGHEFRNVRAISAPNQRDGLAVEDHAAMIGTLDDGTTILVNPSYSNLEEAVPSRRLLWPKSLECNLKITGSEGYFACDYFDRHAYIVGRNFSSPNRLIVDGTPRAGADPADSLMGSFVQAITGQRQRPETGLAEGYQAVRVMNAMYRSIAEEQEIFLS